MLAAAVAVCRQGVLAAAVAVCQHGVLAAAELPAGVTFFLQQVATSSEEGLQIRDVITVLQQQGDVINVQAGDVLGLCTCSCTCACDCSCTLAAGERP